MCVCSTWAEFFRKLTLSGDQHSRCLWGLLLGSIPSRVRERMEAGLDGGRRGAVMQSQGGTQLPCMELWGRTAPKMSPKWCWGDLPFNHLPIPRVTSPRMWAALEEEVTWERLSWAEVTQSRWQQELSSNSTLEDGERNLHSFFFFCNFYFFRMYIIFRILYALHHVH